jgi:hypothetical protein
MLEYQAMQRLGIHPHGGLLHMQVIAGAGASEESRLQALQRGYESVPAARTGSRTGASPHSPGGVHASQGSVTAHVHSSAPSRTGRIHPEASGPSQRQTGIQAALAQAAVEHSGVSVVAATTPNRVRLVCRWVNCPAVLQTTAGFSIRRLWALSCELKLLCAPR